ncbi:hydroxypyruvate isomerase family protein [Antarctobacter jejuensis]|uniref:hydroxypyruvate isomerase family protein n=1 Tax=Antarctobacter jejuensis TaxID=1439938 RepID=UPI003FCFD897
MTRTLQFSANLGFLWTGLPLPQAIRAAHAAGFDAVECHWPYEVPEADVRAALTDTGLPMLGLNTVRGGDGLFGLAALPGQEEAARASIDQAVDYAQNIGAQNIHVMAGVAEGGAAQDSFLANLAYAREVTPAEITLLIEPLNAFDVPGYFLRDCAQGADLIEELGLSGVKLMFDCYHVGRTHGGGAQGVLDRLRDVLPHVGHIQFAAVPDRGAPDHGEVAYREVFAGIADLGWAAPLGAEYRPEGATEESLGWMRWV